MIHEEMRGLQKYLSPPPTPFFKREVPLIEDEETLKKKEEEFVDEIIKTLERNNIKDEFAFLGFINALGMWDISSVKTEDGYEQTKREKKDEGRKWLFKRDNKGIIENNKCEKCMFDAPYKWCCKRECGEHVFCKDCNAKSKGYRSDSESC